MKITAVLPAVARVAPLAIVALFVTSCSEVRVSQPLGDHPLVLQKSAWEGAWFADNEIARVTVADAANGQLSVVVPEQRDGKLQLKSYTVFIRQSDDWLIASLHEDDDAKPDHYVWARVKLTDDQLLVWTPNLAKFRELVRDKKLPGRLDGDNVALGALSAADLKLLTSGALGVPFEWDNPGVARRVAR